MSLLEKNAVFEKNSIFLTIGILLVVAIGGLVEIAPLFFLESTIEKVKGMRPYSPLELYNLAEDIREQHSAFKRMREAFLAVQTLAPDIDTLSMGMSDDLEAAILEGATLVRVGTAIFGARNR